MILSVLLSVHFFFDTALCNQIVSACNVKLPVNDRCGVRAGSSFIYPCMYRRVGEGTQRREKWKEEIVIKIPNILGRAVSNRPKMCGNGNLGVGPLCALSNTLPPTPVRTESIFPMKARRSSSNGSGAQHFMCCSWKLIRAREAENKNLQERKMLLINHACAVRLPVPSFASFSRVECVWSSVRPSHRCTAGQCAYSRTKCTNILILPSERTWEGFLCFDSISETRLIIICLPRVRLGTAWGMVSAMRSWLAHDLYGFYTCRAVEFFKGSGGQSLLVNTVFLL